MALPPSLQRSIARQEAQVLRGQANMKKDRLRLREIWSNYCFHSYTNGAISSAGVLAAGDTYFTFVTSEGQNGQGYPSGLQLSKRDTNFGGNGRVPDNQNFSIWEIGCSIIPARQDVVALDTTKMSQGDLHPDDVDLLCGGVVLEIQYLTNTVPIAMLGDLPGPGGASITAPSIIDFAGNTNVAMTGGGLTEGGAAAASAAPFSARQARWAKTGGQMGPAPALRRKLQFPIFLQAGQTFSFKLNIPRPIQLRTVAKGGTGAFSIRVDLWAAESYFEES